MVFTKYEGYECTQLGFNSMTRANSSDIGSESESYCFTSKESITLKTCYTPYRWSQEHSACITKCPKGSPLDDGTGVCFQDDDECAGRAGDPILTKTGESYQPQSSDYVGGGAFPINFARNYKSFRIPHISHQQKRWEAISLEEQAGWDIYYQPTDYTGPTKKTPWNWVGAFTEETPPIGYRQWQHSYQLSLYQANESSIFMVRANGKKHELVIQADGVNYSPAQPTGDWLVKEFDQNTNHIGWVYTTKNSIKERYDLNGRLTLMINTQGLTQSLNYDAEGRLISVTDASARVLQLAYDSDNRLTQLTQPDGDIIEFNYGVNGNLSQVIYPDDTPSDMSNNPFIAYQYNDPRHPYALTGQVDENGDQYASWVFDNAGRATSSINHNGYKQTTVSYGLHSAVVTEANGQTRDLSFDTVTNKLSQVAGGNCGQCGTSDIANYTYNAQNQIASRTDFNGVTTTFEYNSRGLQTKRVEALGTADERVTNTIWHTSLSLPLEITNERLKTTFTYGSNGRIETMTEADLSSAASPSRVTTYAYNTNGLLDRVIAPNGGVTSFSYDANKDLASIINALGHVTQISSVDLNGRPLSLIDPNGLVTTLTYDPRGQMISQTVSGNTTSFVYDKIGQIIQLTLANGNVTNYQYNGARLLTQVSDALGNKMIYSYDEMGNLTKVDVKDPLNILSRTQSQVYDQLNRLIKQVGATNQTTQYGYDAVGNQISAKNPMLKETLFSFDNLNRLKQSTDPLTGVTQYQYDSQNNLVSVIDPRNNTTSYSYDGFRQLLSQTSPDTKTNRFTYDISGNQLSKTDAKNSTTNYTYDLLNRLTKIDYPGTTLDVTLTYDLGVNGKGRLSSFSNESGSTQYEYNQLGQLVKKISTVADKSFTLNYAFDEAGLLIKITYPSLRVVDLTRGIDGQISKVTSTFAGQTKELLSSATYQPFGAAETFTLGNGKSVSRQFDLDGRISSIDVPSIYQSILAYNDNSNIIQQQTPLQPTMQQDFTYDDLDRLTEAVGLYGTNQFQYDSVSNRTQKTHNTTTESLSYDPLSNRLTTDYQHDDNGNRISDSRFNFQYAVNNRLSEVTPVGETDNSETTAYQYNGLGQRVRKTSLFGDVIYLYDEAGLLIAEANAAGEIVKEYIYFEGQPLTMMVGE